MFIDFRCSFIYRKSIIGPLFSEKKNKKKYRITFYDGERGIYRCMYVKISQSSSAKFRFSDKLHRAKESMLHAFLLCYCVYPVVVCKYIVHEITREDENTHTHTQTEKLLYTYKLQRSNNVQAKIQNATVIDNTYG